jgi:hypothetical protein
MFDVVSASREISAGDKACFGQKSLIFKIRGEIVSNPFLAVTSQDPVEPSPVGYGIEISKVIKIVSPNTLLPVASSFEALSVPFDK